jgi:hypothetical protein
MSLHLMPVREPPAAETETPPEPGRFTRTQLVAAYRIALADAQIRGDWTAASLLSYRLRALRDDLDG